MYYQRTYLDKCATIVNDSQINTGLNPVADLLWGRNLSRMLVYFDHSKIKSLVDEKVYPDINKVHHRLKMTNAGSLDMSELNKVYGSKIDGDSKRRASSFDLIFFLIPYEWDNGKGFDYTKNYLNKEYYDKNSYDYSLYMQKEGVNWYYAQNGYPWKEEINYTHTSNGLFDFYIKSNKSLVDSYGEKIIITYYATCGENFINTKVQFKEINKSLTNPIIIGEPVYFNENGQICETAVQKEQYCTYVQIPITVPKTQSETTRKLTFRLEYELDGKTYKSNPYSVKQLGSKDKYYPQTTDGIYSIKTFEEELKKYNNNEESIIIATQHFDYGTENIDVDITDTFNKFISGTLYNYGIGIAYAPKYESSDSLYENYIGIFTNKTNTFFEPFVETTYDEIIHDDRANFILGKENKLYFYSNIGGNLENLDSLPTCTIDGTSYEVYQATKGVYYINITLPITSNNAPVMHYDKWDGLIYQGTQLPSVELSFTTRPAYNYFGMGNTLPEKNNFTPSTYGIDDNEIIKRGDIRKVCFLVKKNYTRNTAIDIDSIYARMYVWDGKAQIDVIPYREVEKSYLENYLMIDTSILIPETYYIDVKIVYGMESIEHHDVLHFKIVGDSTNNYE